MPGDRTPRDDDNATARDEAESAGTSRLHVTLAVHAGRDQAARVLGAGRTRWLGDLVSSDGDDGVGRYQLDLELRVTDAAPRVAFHKAAYVDIGPLEDAEDGPAVDISWRAAGLTPLFPVFAGRLAWRDSSLVLDGVYAPPGGGVGMVADRLLLNVAARATGRRLLERIAEVLAEG